MELGKKGNSGTKEHKTIFPPLLINTKKESSDSNDNQSPIILHEFEEDFEDDELKGMTDSTSALGPNQRDLGGIIRTE